MSNPHSKAALVCWRARRGGPGFAIALVLLVGLAGGADGSEGRERSGGVSTLGQPMVRCQTKNQPPNLGQGNFVLDRVTECGFAPLASLALSVLPPDPSQATCPIAEAFSVKPGPELVDPAALVQWTADRTRLGNTQYACTLGDMRGVFPRRVR